MQLDLENQSLVGMVLVLDAIATELLAVHLKSLPAAERSASCDRIGGLVAANAKKLLELAPPQLLSNATKIQAASLRLTKGVIDDALAEIGAAADAAPKS